MPMNAFHIIALALDPGFILRARGIHPDVWQQRLLLSEERQILLNCSRQSGKSTTVAALALHTALCRARSLVLLLSPSLRQSMELFRKVLDCFTADRQAMDVMTLNQTCVEFRNRSRIVCLPGREETIRSYSGVNLLVIDEAARVPDDLYRSVRPMLAVSRGRLICLSTPFGKRGFFYEEWVGSPLSVPSVTLSEAKGLKATDSVNKILRCAQNDRGLPGDADNLRTMDNGPRTTGDWLRIRIPWQDCPRIAADFIDLERRSMGESWIRQEYECSFEALEGLVYPDFEEQAVGWAESSRPTHMLGSVDVKVGLADSAHPTSGRRVGGIDFGFRNPFCALWGVLDRDDVLWVTDERYVREAPIHEHAAALKKAESSERYDKGRLPSASCLLPSGSITWYADPAGRTEIEELRHAGLKMLRGNNDIQAGIAAVNARLRTGRLRVRREGCPNLLAEAKLYRYAPLDRGGQGGSEIPIDQDNHALAALRYLVSRLDAGFLARLRKRTAHAVSGTTALSPLPPGERGRGEGGKTPVLLPQVRMDDDALWNTVG